MAGTLSPGRAGLQHIANDVDFGDLVGVSQFDTADLPLSQQVIGRVAADPQHGLQLADVDNVRVLGEHQAVAGGQFLFRNDALGQALHRRREKFSLDNRRQNLLSVMYCDWLNYIFANLIIKL